MNVSGVGRSSHVYYSFPRHEHGYWEVMLNLTGQGRMDIGGEVYDFKPGDIFIIPPATPHEKKSEEGFEDICLFIDNFRNIGKPGVKRFQDDERNNARMIMEMAFEFWNRGENKNNMAVVNVIGDLLYQLLACFYNQGRKPDIRIETVLEQMHENISNADFSLKDAVTRCGYSPSYFRKLFKNAMGESPLSYFNHLRVSQAKSLIQQYGTSRMIKDIAADCGFSDPLYFCRVFKKYEKISPDQYLQRIQVIDEAPIFLDKSEEALRREMICRDLAHSTGKDACTR